MLQVVDTPVTDASVCCPICQHDSQQKTHIAQRDIYQCGYCRHQFVPAISLMGRRSLLDPLHLEPVTPSDQASDQDGMTHLPRTVGYSDNLAQANALRRQGRYYGRLLSRYLPTGEAFDVSAGMGFRLQGLADAGWRVTGIESNVEMVDYARQSLNLPVELGQLETWPPDNRLTRGGYDLVTLIQVIPSWAQLHQSLKVARRLTKWRGYWLIEAHNRNSLRARLLNTHWPVYHQPEIKHWFAIADMIQLGRQFGFRPIAWGQPTYAGGLLPWNRQNSFWLLLQKVAMAGPKKL